MFYAAEALLASRGLTFSKHTGVIAAINREFVRAGELAVEHFENMTAAFQERNVADYGHEQTVSEETARTVLTRAEAFVLAVEAKLGR